MIPHFSRERLDDGLHRTNHATLPKLTDEVNGRRRFRDDPPTVTRRADRLRRELGEVLAAYRRSLTIDRRLFLDRYTVTDVARKVVGCRQRRARILRPVAARHRL